MIKKIIYFSFRCLSSLGLVLFMYLLKVLYGLEFLGEIGFVISLSVFISVVSRMGSEYASYRHMSTKSKDSEAYNSCIRYFTCGITASLIVSVVISLVVFIIYRQYNSVIAFDIRFLFLYSITLSILQFLASSKRSLSMFFSSYALDQGAYYLIISIILLIKKYLFNLDVDKEFLYSVSLLISFIMVPIGFISMGRFYSLQSLKYNNIKYYIKDSFQSLNFSLYEYYLFWAPGIVSGWFFSMSTVGAISLGMRLFQVMIFGISLLNVFCAPKILELFKDSENDPNIPVVENRLDIVKHKLKGYKKSYISYFYMSIVSACIVFLFMFYKETSTEYIMIALLFLILGVARSFYGPIFHVFNYYKMNASRFFYGVCITSLILMCILSYYSQSPILMLSTYLFCWLFTMQYMVYRLNNRRAFWKSIW